jgi:glycosyltransferase involved in cell wall biosynthesis
VRILLWNVHGSWDTAFVLGTHDYIVPVTPGRGPDGRGVPQRLGVDPAAIWVFDDLPQRKMHAELARRRVYLHPFRWTSLGLSLLEAMLLGMPVVALATTETADAVPPEAGVVSNRLDVLTSAGTGVRE